jgi:hypothetical protein
MMEAFIDRNESGASLPKLFRREATFGVFAMGSKQFSTKNPIFQIEILRLIDWTVATTSLQGDFCRWRSKRSLCPLQNFEYIHSFLKILSGSLDIA